ncbi:hypothetical protein VTK73DRAFT_7790 [Phialemonium thermophilum]|uniref:Uncharacterized protein n=1 Tax=Phialemonium thermophilum TaxID=223376 RepID=A0ABR3WCQ8_9PEZI
MKDLPVAYGVHAHGRHVEAQARLRRRLLAQVLLGTSMGLLPRSRRRRGPGRQGCHRPDIGRLAAALRVEDGLLGNDDVVLVGALLEQLAIRLLESGKWPHCGHDGSQHVQLGVVLKGEKGSRGCGGHGLESESGDTLFGNWNRPLYTPLRSKFLPGC